MKVASILSVVVLVAVSQPFPFNFPQHPQQKCDLIGQNMQCCFPKIYGGCDAEPGRFPPGMAPPQYRPNPQFLNSVCCTKGTECCPADQKSRFPTFKCCKTTDGEVCGIKDSKGSCIKPAAANGTTPHTSASTQLLNGGQCPLDGSLPYKINANEVRRCSLNPAVTGYKCPTDSVCVRDNSNNVNSGVCCADTTKKAACDQYTTCMTCVVNKEKVTQPCGWLSQGQLNSVEPRCVQACDNFPTKSCVVPSDGKLCPRVSGQTNGTVVNTGDCKRRCGKVGTGRAARINNNGNNVLGPNPNITVTTCCTEYPGDYCCDPWSGLASHCTSGRSPGGPLCGVPIRGTPNQLYEAQPYNPYAPSPWQQNNYYGNNNNNYSPYGPAPMPYNPYMPNQFQPYQQQQYNPYMGGGNVYGGFGPQPFGPVPMGPWSPFGSPYGGGLNMYGRESEEVSDATSKEAVAKQLMFMPAPMFYPPMPPPQPRPLPPIVDILPSQFVCSCDKECKTYVDCCEDFATECV